MQNKRLLLMRQKIPGFDTGLSKPLACHPFTSTGELTLSRYALPVDRAPGIGDGQLSQSVKTAARQGNKKISGCPEIENIYILIALARCPEETRITLVGIGMIGVC